MKPEQLRILLVEDNGGDTRLMLELLCEAGYDRLGLQHVETIRSALNLLREQPFDIVLLDLSLPDGTGLETVQQVCEAIPEIPVIVLTGNEDDSLPLAAMQSGAQDYLGKGRLDGAGIARAIRYAVERKRLEERLLHLATHDELTGLPNRRLFQDRMRQAVDRAARNRKDLEDKWIMAVLLVDLDNFKSVNDNLGHSTGDILLQAVANRLQGSIRKSDTLARMGGDEFTLIFENVTGREDAGLLAGKIHALFSQPFNLDRHLLEITASIGVSQYPDDGEDAETLLKNADIAMYRAKRDLNKVSFYHECKD